LCYKSFSFDQFVGREAKQKGGHMMTSLSLQKSVLLYSPVVKAKFFSCTTCTNTTSGHVAKFSTAKENSCCH